MRKAASILAIVGGIIMAVAGVITWVVINNTLSAQKITVAESHRLAGDTVDGPFSAYCQADVIDKHTMDITGRKTYAELDREDPVGRPRWTPLSYRHRCSPRSWRSALRPWRSVLESILTLIGFAIRTPAPTVAAATPPDSA